MLRFLPEKLGQGSWHYQDGKACGGGAGTFSCVVGDHVKLDPGKVTG